MGRKRLQDLFLAFHHDEVDLADSELDQALGLNIPAVERYITDQQLHHRYGLEQFTYQATPYAYARQFIEAVSPTASDIVYDLGCGYGQVVLYTALVTNAKAIGVENVAERVQAAQAVKEKHGIERAEFHRQNVLDCDFSDGTNFFLFNPFIDTTLVKVVARLKTIATQRTILIAAWGGPVGELIEKQDWLEEIIDRTLGYTLDPRRLRVYRSK